MQPFVGCGKLTPMSDEHGRNTRVRASGWTHSLRFITMFVSPIWQLEVLL